LDVVFPVTAVHLPDGCKPKRGVGAGFFDIDGQSWLDDAWSVRGHVRYSKAGNERSEERESDD
jgi:hypothetical protein